MIPLPIATARLLLRCMRPDDAEAFAAYRSHPEVACYQGWEVPYPPERARRLLDDQADLPGPTPGAWVQLAVDVGSALAGDVAVHLDAAAAVAEVGYTLDPVHQGRGYAVEAVGAVVDALFARGVHRVEAVVDPANRASRRVLERLGFEREGVARQAHHDGGGWTDDERWGLLRDDRAAWRNRPTGRPATVRLVDLHGCARRYAALRVHPTQEHLVATVSASYADALFPEADDAGTPLVPWLRGVEADGEPAGFVLCAEPTPTFPEPFLWRLLIDRRHQGRGIGATVIASLVARYGGLGYRSLLTSWVPGPGTPEGFYLGLGFAATGEVVDDEVTGRLAFDG